MCGLSSTKAKGLCPSQLNSSICSKCPFVLFFLPEQHFLSCPGQNPLPMPGPPEVCKRTAAGQPKRCGFFCLFVFFSFLAFLRHMEFPGQGSDPSHSCDLSCSCSITGCLTHRARLWIEPASSDPKTPPILLHCRGNSRHECS